MQPVLTPLLPNELAVLQQEDVNQAKHPHQPDELDPAWCPGAKYT